MSSLQGIKVIEIEGVGPAPVAGMMLADLGAEVILVQRKTANKNATGIFNGSKQDYFNRGKKTIALDLKRPESIELVLMLVEKADMFIEGFRPGVAERLGLGPETCLAVNPKLIYGRMTGWGQSGPLSHAAGHDLNFISISGALNYCGLPGDAPFSPGSLIGDIGGGSLHLVMGMLAALHHVHRTGEGQVVDAAICDGAAYMMTLFSSMYATGVVGAGKGEDFITGASHWMRTYECADGKYITVQAVEPGFYKEFISIIGYADDPDFINQHDKKTWPAAIRKLTEYFKRRPQAYWTKMLEGTDACYAPVLTLDDAAEHPHNLARNNFIKNDGFIEPAPAPKFSKTPSKPGKIPEFGEHTDEILQSLNLGDTSSWMVRRKR